MGSELKQIRWTEDRRMRFEAVERMTGLKGVAPIIDYLLAYFIARHGGMPWTADDGEQPR